MRLHRACRARLIRLSPLLIGLWLAAPGCGTVPEQRLVASGNPLDDPAPAPRPVDVAAEAERLTSDLIREVPDLSPDTAESTNRWLALAERTVAAARRPVTRPQLLVVVDRNPAVQEMRILLASPLDAWRNLGGTKVSTGQAGRHGYFLTPTGVYVHTDAILDWRAEGTFNANRIRGLGLKGMRVWDFGWQRAERGWGRAGEEGDIRLLLHATDPDTLEQRLGQAASKGCVRIPSAMNRFLDRHGVLDADYEAAARFDSRIAALLLPDRRPTPLAGTMLVVVDSAEMPQARTSTRIE